MRCLIEVSDVATIALIKLSPNEISGVIYEAIHIILSNINNKLNYFSELNSDTLIKYRILNCIIPQLESCMHPDNLR